MWRRSGLKWSSSTWMEWMVNQSIWSMYIRLHSSEKQLLRARGWPEVVQYHLSTISMVDLMVDRSWTTGPKESNRGTLQPPTRPLTSLAGGALSTLSTHHWSTLVPPLPLTIVEFHCRRMFRQDSSRSCRCWHVRLTVVVSDCIRSTANASTSHCFSE